MFEDDPDPGKKHRLAAWESFVAPVAARSDAISPDPQVDVISEAVFNVFAARDSAQGLTRGEIWAACAGVCDEQRFDQRYETFKDLGMLIPAFDKKNEGRHLLHPNAPVGLVVFQRIASEGGIDEVLSLLDRTGAAIRRGDATSDQVASALWKARGMLGIAANYLLLLVRRRSIEVMVAERHQHRHPHLIEDVRAVTLLVNERFPHLDPMAYEVTVEAQRYLGVRTDFVERLLEEGARAEDFGLLRHEQYLTAARGSSLEALAEALSGFVFDPPHPRLNPETIVRELDSLTPAPPERAKPARPSTAVEGDDPFAAMQERERRRSELAKAQAEVLLSRQSEVDLTVLFLERGWPGAAGLLVRLLHACATDPKFEIVMRDVLRVDPAASVTYLSQVVLRLSEELDDQGEPRG
ncbi:hypothetical protein ACIBG7_18850 [Nonomuraea sp. NPDC050328]|uniref:hypothetical protein n=1 Tax=Nonomuraea sp. NPDC050328 TaxID=3364361 RepID=UPI00378F0051